VISKNTLGKTLICSVFLMLLNSLSSQDKKVEKPKEKVEEKAVAVEKTEPTLKSIVLKSLKTHPQIKKLERSRAVAYQEVRSAKGAFLPTVDFRTTYGPEYTQNQTVENDGDHYRTLWRNENSLIINQTLYDGGARESVLKRNHALFDRTLNSINDGKEALALRAVEAYISVLRSRKQIALSAKNIEAHMDILKVVKKRFENKLVPEADVVQVQGRLALAQAQLRREMADLKASEAAFIEVCGEEPGKLQEPEDLLKSLPEDIKSAQNEAVVSHPSVLANKDTIRAVESSIHEAASRFSPRVSLELTGAENENLSGNRSNDDSYSALIVLNWNLFRGGSDFAELSREIYRREQESFNLYETKRNLARDVAQAWFTKVGKQEELEFFKKHELASEKTYDAYKSQYELGKPRTLFDLLNARSEFFRAKFNVIDAEYSIKSTEYRILATMGRLVQYFEALK